MANSRFDYVKSFESDDRILPNCWIIVRIDGKAFHKFTKAHNFEKPNDDNGKNLIYLFSPIHPVHCPMRTQSLKSKTSSPKYCL